MRYSSHPATDESPNSISFRMTKAGTLDFLRDRVTRSKVPDFLAIRQSDWEANKSEKLSEIFEIFGSQRVAIRSSASNEDSASASMAGMYISFLDVLVETPQSPDKYIDEIFSDFAKDPESDKDLNEVIVQSYVHDSILSGVIFTRDLTTGAPHYSINYDDQSSKTDTVTLGSSISRTLHIRRDGVEFIQSPRWKPIIEAVREIEHLIGRDCLDIEFALSESGAISVFQARLLATQQNWDANLDSKMSEQKEVMRHYLQGAFQPQTGVYGSQSLYSQMSDWNPAEMIGTSPKPLAASLYCHLISDQAWQVGRSRLGYAAPANTKLITFLAGQPFVDVRLSFHSLTANSLEPDVASAVVEAWIAQLSQNPDAHDKIEFEITTTFVTLDIEKRYSETGLRNRIEAAYLEAFHASILSLSNAILANGTERVNEELAKLQHLEEIRTQLSTDPSEISKDSIEALLNATIEFGTTPFAAIARHGFIGMDFLRSMEASGIITEKDKSEFMSSLDTITTRFLSDSESLKNGNISSERFMETYGHLRPGTYEITSKRYKDIQELFFKGSHPPPPPHPPESENQKYNLSDAQSAKLSHALDELGLDTTPQSLMDYIASAIRGRENAKFLFTRSVSDCLELIAKWGESRGLTREELSFLSIDEILNADQKVESLALLQSQIDEAQSRWHVSQAFVFPAVIKEIGDIYIVPMQICRPNFITKKSVSASTVELHEQIDPQSLVCAIVITECADPGFDWIFNWQIGGLVTKYGGANSHLAIRCAELAIPAAIGCGPNIYDQILKCSSLTLDCSGNRILSLSGAILDGA